MSKVAKFIVYENNKQLRADTYEFDNKHKAEINHSDLVVSRKCIEHGEIKIIAFGTINIESWAYIFISSYKKSVENIKEKCLIPIKLDILYKHERKKLKMKK